MRDVVATKLTTRFCDSVRPVKGKQASYPDAQVPGLEFRVSGEGRKAWSLRYRTRDGRQRRLSLGVFPVVTLESARIAALKALAAVADGGDPAGERRREKHRARTQAIQTFDDLIADYFHACEAGTWRPKGKAKRERTIRDERNTYRLYLERTIGNMRLSEITRAVVKTRLRELAGRGLGATVNRTHALVRQAFAYGVSEELGDVTANPATGFSPIVSETPRTRVFSDSELKAFWSALAEPPETVRVGRLMRISLQLCALLLQRKGEIIGMMVSELALDQGLWLIPGERMKGRKPHLVPLPPRAVELIVEAIKLSERPMRPGETEPIDRPVFPSPRGNGERTVRPDSVSHAMAEITAALQINGVSPHDLRRTGATALTSERIGVSPFIRSQVLGHTSDAGGGAAVSRAHYDVNTYLPEKRRALEAWESLLLEIVGERPRAPNAAALREGMA